MKLIGIEHSRLITLFVASRPDGQIPLPRAINLLVERYKFASFPTTLEDLAKPSVSFREGHFKGMPIDAFDVHSDGVVLRSKTSTSVLDDFVDDLSSWMEEAVGLKRVKTHSVDKNYESELIIQCEAPVLRALDALSPIQELVGKAIAKATNLNVKIHGVGLALGADQTSIPGMKPIAFRLERKAEVPFESNFYYSSAPVGTEEHMAILERIEKLV